VSAVAQVVLSRIEMERVRLQSARRALDGVSASAPRIASATVAKLVLAIDSTNDDLVMLGGRTRTRGVTKDRLEDLALQATATDRVVREAFALAAGVLARSHGLDGGACAEADSLIAELAEVVDNTLARPTIPGDSEFLHRAADLIRRRLPDHGVWDLPVMAHEFGHVLAKHLHVYDPVSNQVLELGEDVLGGWPECSAVQAEELFCDLLACYATGPSYACTLLVHRLDPVATAAFDPAAPHPPDAVRAAVVLGTLTLLTKGERSDSRYRMTCNRLRTTWRELQLLAPAKAQLTPEQEEDVLLQVRVVLDFLSHRLKPLRYDWPRAGIRELTDALRGIRPVDVGGDYRIRDVLNAAWLLRLSASAANPLPAQVETGARALIGRARQGGAGDAA
jgi:hypothetical protein